MLLQFTVKNFLSFRDEENFKMSATADSNHPNHVNSIEDDKYRVLKTAAIYGANGSGKTNLVEAIRFIQRLVVEGIKPKQNIPIRKFKLSDKSAKEPSQFEIEIYFKNHRYLYGIVVTEKEVLEEWLYVTRSEGRQTTYFERSTKNGKVNVEPGVKLKESSKEGFISFIAEGTRPEQPFLTELELRNVEPIHELMEWFRDALNIIDCSAIYPFLPLRIHKDKDFTNALGKFLRIAGTGIDGINAEEIDFDIKKEFGNMPEELKQQFLGDLDGKTRFVLHSQKNKNEMLIVSGTREAPKAIRVNTLHKGSNGEIEFSLSEESAGTQRLLHLFPSLFSLAFTPEENVFIIDELDRSLHPHLSKLFLETFLNNSKGQNQLIFTTHEDCLLNLDLLRRDEIWFIEKDDEQASHCYPLTDFKVRTDLEIRKGYLNGRFGAIPFPNDPKLLGWDALK